MGKEARRRGFPRKQVRIARMVEVVGWGEGWGHMLEGWVPRVGPKGRSQGLRSVKNLGQMVWS